MNFHEFPRIYMKAIRQRCFEGSRIYTIGGSTKSKKMKIRRYIMHLSSSQNISVFAGVKKFSFESVK